MSGATIPWRIKLARLLIVFFFLGFLSILLLIFICLFFTIGCAFRVAFPFLLLILLIARSACIFLLFVLIIFALFVIIAIIVYVIIWIFFVWQLLVLLLMLLIIVAVAVGIFCWRNHHFGGMLRAASLRLLAHLLLNCHVIMVLLIIVIHLIRTWGSIGHAVLINKVYWHNLRHVVVASWIFAHTEPSGIVCAIIGRCRSIRWSKIKHVGLVGFLVVFALNRITILGKIVKRNEWGWIVVYLWHDSFARRNLLLWTLRRALINACALSRDSCKR